MLGVRCIVYSTSVRGVDARIAPTSSLRTLTSRCTSPRHTTPSNTLTTRPTMPPSRLCASPLPPPPPSHRPAAPLLCAAPPPPPPPQVRCAACVVLGMWSTHASGAVQSVARCMVSHSVPREVGAVCLAQLGESAEVRLRDMLHDPEIGTVLFSSHALTAAVVHSRRDGSTPPSQYAQ